MRTINRNLVAGCAAVAVSACLAGGAHAADVTAAADIASAYVWRGITFNDSFVIQPSVDVAGPAGLGFNVWGNFDLDDYEAAGIESGNFSEVDLTVSYAVPLEVEGVELGVGLIEYLFPDASGSTREVYADASVDLGAGLGAGAFVAYDFDEVNDVYANVSLSYGMDVSDELSVELGGLIGFAGSDFSSGPDSGAHEFQVSLGAAYAASEVTELGAFIAYTDAVDSDVLAETDVDVYGGLSASYAF